MELRKASDRDLVNYYKYLHKVNEHCEKLRSQLKEHEAALPIARLLVPHPGGPKIAPLVDRLKEALGHLATYVKHLAKSIPNPSAYLHEGIPPKGASGCGGLWSCGELYRRIVQDPTGGDDAHRRTSHRQAEPPVDVPV
jgi:hypothetical protein